MRGTVREIWAQEGYGVVSADGQDYRFERRDTGKGVFGKLVAGAEVSFEVVDSEDGPRAHGIRIERISPELLP